MDFAKEMKKKASEYQNRLVLPEGTEERTVVAAAHIMAEKLAKSVTLLGNRADIEKVACAKGVDLGGVDILDPADSDWHEEFSKTYCELRAKKGMTSDQAKIDMKDALRFGAMMVRLGKVDAMVAGARSTTAHVLRAGLAIIGTAPGMKTVSSCFVMDMHDPKWGYDGILIFADCAVVPSPNAEQLADIAEGAAHSCRTMLGVEPAIAMLSFSTKGSGGDHEHVVRVRDAVRIAKGKFPDLCLDGEIQVDAALVPAVTEKKAPGSPISGRVNTLVFPDLASGNIGYKLVQRLANADAFGPILQGFALPISDLSRGCSIDEIVITAAITLVQAGKK